MTEHIATCAQLEKVPCPAGKSLHGEPIDEHWWSGWPGAYCLKCHDEDKDEVCVGTVCECPCHEDFWRSYEEAMYLDDTAPVRDPDDDLQEVNGKVCLGYYTLDTCVAPDCVE